MQAVVIDLSQVVVLCPLVTSVAACIGTGPYAASSLVRWGGIAGAAAAPFVTARPSWLVVMAAMCWTVLRFHRDQGWGPRWAHMLLWSAGTLIIVLARPLGDLLGLPLEDLLPLIAEAVLVSCPIASALALAVRRRAAYRCFLAGLLLAIPLGDLPDTEAWPALQALAAGAWLFHVIPRRLGSWVLAGGVGALLELDRWSLPWWIGLCVVVAVVAETGRRACRSDDPARRERAENFATGFASATAYMVILGTFFVATPLGAGWQLSLAASLGVSGSLAVVDAVIRLRIGRGRGAAALLACMVVVPIAALAGGIGIYVAFALLGAAGMAVSVILTDALADGPRASSIKRLGIATGVKWTALAALSMFIGLAASYGHAHAILPVIALGAAACGWALIPSLRARWRAVPRELGWREVVSRRRVWVSISITSLASGGLRPIELVAVPTLMAAFAPYRLAWAAPLIFASAFAISLFAAGAVSRPWAAFVKKDPNRAAVIMAWIEALSVPWALAGHLAGGAGKPAGFLLAYWGVDAASTLGLNAEEARIVRGPGDIRGYALLQSIRFGLWPLVSSVIVSLLGGAILAVLATSGAFAMAAVAITHARAAATRRRAEQVPIDSEAALAERLRAAGIPVDTWGANTVADLWAEINSGECTLTWDRYGNPTRHVRAASVDVIHGNRRLVEEERPDFGVGGKLGPEETPEQAARRELGEELRIPAGDLALVPVGRVRKTRTSGSKPELRSEYEVWWFRLKDLPDEHYREKYEEDREGRIRTFIWEDLPIRRGMLRHVASLCLLWLVGGIEWVAGLLLGSATLISDGKHTIGDSFDDVGALVANSRWARRIAGRRVDALITVFIGAFMIGLAIEMLIETAAIHPGDRKPATGVLPLVLAATALLVRLGVAPLRRRAGRDLESQASHAGADHARTDLVGCFLVLVVMTAMPSFPRFAVQLDLAGAYIVAGLTLWTGAVNVWKAVPQLRRPRTTRGRPAWRRTIKFWRSR